MLYVVQCKDDLRMMMLALYGSKDVVESVKEEECYKQ